MKSNSTEHVLYHFAGVACLALEMWESPLECAREIPVRDTKSDFARLR